MNVPQTHAIFVDGQRWLVCCARFATETHARNTFELLAKRLGSPSDDERGVGYYRHGVDDGSGHVNGRFVTIVGLEHGEPNVRLERAVRVLAHAGGEDERLPQLMSESIVRRRIAIVRANAGETGRMRVRSSGRVLLPDGTMVPYRRPQG